MTIRDAEAAVTALSSAPEFLGPAIVDLSSTRELAFGAGSRIGNALSRYKGSLEVVLPNNASSKQFYSDYWSTYARSGLGRAIARYAASIRSGADSVLAQFKEIYDTSADNAQNLVVLAGIASPAILHADDANVFANRLRGLFPKVNVAPAAFPTEAFDRLMELCRESVLNVQDHAYKSPLTGEEGLNYFSMRYYRELPKRSDEYDPLYPYIKRLWKHRKAIQEQTSGFLEFVVSDDGNGVAARQSQDSEIYWRPQDAEQSALEEALRAGGSIKPRVRDAIMRGDPGFGFSTIAQSLRELQGFASLRTGRFLIVCDGSRSDPMGREFSIARGLAGHVNFIPGSLIQVVLPIRAAQTRLSLD